MEVGTTGYIPPQDPNSKGVFKSKVDVASWEDEVDLAFMKRVIREVTQSCVLPSPIPLERIPEIILNAAGWFWENDDSAVEQRFYFIPYSELCKNNTFNKIVQLPQQIMGIQGCYRSSETMYGNLGDFSIERMMMSSYATFGGLGSVGGGMGYSALDGSTGFKLSDVVVGMYEIDTFKQTLNPTLSYNYNEYSKKLVILGDCKMSNIVIDAWKRVRLQDLYNSHYFFRYCVCLVKLSLSQIYGTFSFKYPGGVEINLDVYRDPANEEIEKIEEWIANNHAADYFYQPNVI
jgi:hypothetical protein